MAKVKDISVQIRGVSYKPDDLHDKLDDNSVILLRANNIDHDKLNFDDVVYVDKSKVNNAQYLRSGDILVCASSGSKNLVGKAAIIKNEIAATFGAFCKVVRPININPRYLGHYFTSPKYRETISQLSAGANINNIRNEHIDSLDILIPDTETQQQIAATLDSVTNVIDLCNGFLEKLDLLVKARFVEMFGDIIINTKQWDIRVFDEITTSRLGKMLDAKQQTGNSTFQYLANFNVQWFRFELSNLNSMDFDEKDQKEFALIDGDLLVCEGGEIGRCAIWHNDIEPCFFQKALHRVRCDQSVILPVYLAWWFKFNCDHDGFFEIAGAKATIAHLPGAKLKKLNVVVPPLALQEQFAAFVAQTDQTKSAVKKVLEKAETLKKALMQEYFGP